MMKKTFVFRLPREFLSKLRRKKKKGGVESFIFVLKQNCCIFSAQIRKRNKDYLH